MESQVEEARDGVRAMDVQRRALVEHLKNIELEVHGLKNRITQDKQDIERLTKDIKNSVVIVNKVKLKKNSAHLQILQTLKIRLDLLNNELEKQIQVRTRA